MHSHFLSLLLLPIVRAWGEIGHGTVAAIAVSHLDWRARALVQNTLAANETIVTEASWADGFRRTPAGKFSGAFQYAETL